METRPLSYAQKSRIVYEYLHKYAIDTFVETGTYKGAGVANALGQVKEAYSIEIDAARYMNARSIFDGFPNVHLYHGDSGKLLPEIMPELKGRCLFWLDAHYGDDEAIGQRRTPIIDELDTVLNYQGDFIVLIDDARLYTGEGDWPSLKTLGDRTKSKMPNCKFFIKDDIIRVLPEAIKPIAENKFISMSSLGTYGRFGNQLFQYAALRTYARNNGLRTEIPEDWIGRRLFLSCNDLPVSDRPREQKMLGGDCIWQNGELLEGCDIKGYCQYHTSFYDRDMFRALFKFYPGVEDSLRKPLVLLKQQGTIIGIHIRRADYRLPGRSANIAPTKWYLEWLDENWKKIDNPILFVASDEIDNVAPDFTRYRPSHFRAGADFLFDFYALASCDILLISNSTFSFTAAMLNNECGEFYRPDFRENKLVSFEPWNSEPLLKP